MSPELQKEFDEMKSRLREVELYVQERKATQLVYPLDNQSRQIIQIGTVLVAGRKETSGAPFTNDGYIPLSINGTVYKFMTTA